MKKCHATILTLATALVACSGGITSGGTVQVFVEPEDTIPDGLEPGSGAENIEDGWRITYEKFLVGIGNVRAAQSGKPGATLSDPRVYVVDLQNTPAGGLVIATFTDAEATRWDKFGFDLAHATDSATKGSGLSEADYDLMVSGGYSLFLRGTMTRAGGRSCLPTAPGDCVAREVVTFTWGLEAGTSFDDCAAPTGEAGFAVPSGGTVSVKPTIHGDHWFFTNLTQGAELTRRRAQWIADADLNRDGDTTLEELAQVRAADVFTQAKGYNLSGALVPVVSAADYLEAQARTLGDFQGEGECPTRAILQEAR
jgi:hypothetical protein